MADHRINRLVLAAAVADFFNKIGPKADLSRFGDDAGFRGRADGHQVRHRAAGDRLYRYLANS